MAALTAAPSSFRASLPADARAAFVSLFLALPQAIAFAALAHMPVAAAILASVVPTAIAALLGREPHVITGPASMLALGMGATLGQWFAPGSADALAAAAWITAMIALFQFAAYATGMVKVLRWMPNVATAGITAGIGVSIILSQWPVIVGAQGLPQMVPVWSQALWAWRGAWRVDSVLAFAITLAIGIALEFSRVDGLRRLRWPVAAAIGSALMLRPDVATLGNLGVWMAPTAMHLFHPGVVVGSMWPEFIGPALTLSALALTQSMLVSEGRTPDAVRREALFQAVANAAAALLCAFPVAASVNRTRAHLRAGARTWVSVLILAVFTLLSAWLFSPALSFIALPALAALLCAVGIDMVRAAGRQWVAWAFAATTVFLGIGFAVAAAIAYGVHAHATTATGGPGATLGPRQQLDDAQS